MDKHIDFHELAAEYEQLAFRLSARAADLREQAKFAPTQDIRQSLQTRAKYLDRIAHEKLREAGKIRMFIR